jgi:23S rRNA (adenine2503-C2)-methyltransferase
MDADGEKELIFLTIRVRSRTSAVLRLDWYEMALSDFDIASLSALFERWGYPRGNAGRLLRRYYNCGAEGLDGTIVSPVVASRLMQEVGLRGTSIASRREAADGTVKLLVALQAEKDERRTANIKLPTASEAPAERPVPAHRPLPTAHSSSTVECVLMPSHRPDRAAACVSSQVGCAMGCDFCASTKAGVERSLTSGEIVEQFLWLRWEALQLGRRLQTLVFMGMGEPLMNYDNVVAAIRRIAGGELGALGWRHVTVSTVGIVPGIDRLREENLGVHLAVSLHAPDDDTRSAIVPTGRRYRVADILAAVQRYQQASGRIATIEYTLLEDVNDSDAQAELLAQRLADCTPDATTHRDTRMHVNLIPYNSIGPGLSGRVYQRPQADRMNRFLEILRDRGVVAHFRRTRGDDIEGACGQLRERVGSALDDSLRAPAQK